MPSKVQEKCRQCSKLSVETAITRHGEQGDGCWVGELCHKRRTYYKKRNLYNRNRRLNYRGKKESAQLDAIAIATVPRSCHPLLPPGKDEPLHAIEGLIYERFKWTGQ